METLLRVGLSNAVAALVLALVAVLVALVWRRPALLHGLWLLVLIKLVTPPLVPISFPWPASQANPPAALAVDPGLEPASEPEVQGEERLEFILPFEALPAVAEAAPEAAIPGGEPLVARTERASSPPGPDWSAWVASWQTVIVSVWLLGTVSWFVLALVRLLRFGRVLRHARPAPAKLVDRVRRLARQVGLKRIPHVCLVPGQLTPMLWAVGRRPRLVLPAELFERMPQEQQNTLLLHELAHLRRRDHLVRLLEFVVRGLYWWHPVVWYACRELRETEEQCCDAWVVSTLPGSGRTYAIALVETLDFLSEARPAVPLLASGIGHVSDLKRRLQMIMGGTTPRSLNWSGLLAVLVLAGFVLPLGPSWGQEKRLFRIVGNTVVEVEPGDTKPADVPAKAQDEIKKLEDELRKKRDEMIAIEKKLAAAAAKLRLPAEAEHKQFRIWIQKDLTAPGTGGAPGGKSREIILREVDGKWIIVTPPQQTGNKPQEKKEIRIFPGAPGQPGAGAEWRIVPPTPGTPALPSVGPKPPTPPALPRLPGNDPRIDQLERKLQELEKLIRDLKKTETNEPYKLKAILEPKKTETTQPRPLNEAEKKKVEQLLRSTLQGALPAGPQAEKMHLELKIENLEELLRELKKLEKPQPNPQPKPSSR